MHRHDRILKQLRSQPLALEAGWFNTIQSIVKDGGSFEALQAAKMGKLEHTEKAYTRDGVAVLPLSGPIFPKANLLSEVSGATSLEMFAQDWYQAANDDSIHTLVADIDSPGGVVTDIAEMAALVSATGKKTVAYVRGAAGSAAYWITSAFSEVVMSPTARVGSIGVIAAASTAKEEDEVEFISSQSPYKRLDPNTEDGRKHIQAWVDELAEVFIDDVARYRGVSTDTVMTDFGKGDMVIAKQAVQVGMADRIMTFEGLMSELVSQHRGEAHMNVSELKAKHPATYVEIVGIGKAEADSELTALKETNKKLQDDLGAALAVNEELVAKVADAERKDAVRKLQDAQAQASAILDTAVTASAIPQALHTKVKAAVPGDRFIADGVLDADAYKAVVAKEISEWAAAFPAAGDAGAVLGGGDAGIEFVGDSAGNAEVDAAVKRMASYIGIN